MCHSPWFLYMLKIGIPKVLISTSLYVPFGFCTSCHSPCKLFNNNNFIITLNNHMSKIIKINWFSLISLRMVFLLSLEIRWFCRIFFCEENCVIIHTTIADLWGLLLSQYCNLGHQKLCLMPFDSKEKNLV